MRLFAPHSCRVWIASHDFRHGPTQRRYSTCALLHASSLQLLPCTDAITPDPANCVSPHCQQKACLTTLLVLGCRTQHYWYWVGTTQSITNQPQTSSETNMQARTCRQRYADKDNGWVLQHCRRMNFIQCTQHHRRMLRGQADVGASFCDEHTAITLAMQTTVGATTATQHTGQQNERYFMLLPVNAQRPAPAVAPFWCFVLLPSYPRQA